MVHLKNTKDENSSGEPLMICIAKWQAGANAINIFFLCFSCNKALRLDVESHVISFSQLSALFKYWLKLGT